jgi:hypothetical protein
MSAPRSMPQASLKEIVDALEMQFEEHLNYLDRQTGKVEMVTRDDLRLVEADDSADMEADDSADMLPEGQQSEFDIAEALFEDPDRFVRLPTEWDIHEWEIMREFAESVEPERLSRDLLQALQGKGAFRYFKDTLRRYRREESWYDYRTRALREIAVDWCKENGIDYRED